MSKMPDKVRKAFDDFPQPLRNDFLDLRNLIFEVTDETPGVGPLEETLKWGQPAYLTSKTKAGSTIRLGTSKTAPETAHLFFICHSGLVEDMRSQFPDAPYFVGNRALQIDRNDPDITKIAKICIAKALTWHLRKRKKKN